MDEFEKTVDEEDVEKVVEILKGVGITYQSSIKLILEELGLNKNLRNKICG